MYGFKILYEISKVPFEISHNFFNPYTTKSAFYEVLKIWQLGWFLKSYDISSLSERGPWKWIPVALRIMYKNPAYQLLSGDPVWLEYSSLISRLVDQTTVLILPRMSLCLHTWYMLWELSESLARCVVSILMCCELTHVSVLSVVVPVCTWWD